MKKTILKTAIAGTIISGVLLSGMQAHAMTNTEISDYILKQVQSESTLTDTELSELKTELKDISKSDIISGLKEEANELSEEKFKKEILSSISKAEKITQTASFMKSVEDIYTKLDNHYETTEDYFDEDEDFEDDIDLGEFSIEDKDEIIDYLKEELSFAENDEIKTQISNSINALKNIKDSEKFSNALDTEYEKIDSLYSKHYSEEDFDFDDQDSEFSFEDTKKETLKYLKEDISQIKDENLKKELLVQYSKIEKTTTEGDFYNNIDALYDSKTLNAYYEKEGISFIDSDEIWEFDLNKEKEEILADVLEEINEIENKEKQTELKKLHTNLSKITDQDKFFDALDEIYEKIDTLNGHSYDFDDDDFDDYEDEDFDDEDFDKYTPKTWTSSNK